MLFNESAELKAKKLEAVKQQEKTLTEEVVRDFRLTGDPITTTIPSNGHYRPINALYATLPNNKHPNCGLLSCLILVKRIRNSGVALPGWIFIRI